MTKSTITRERLEQLADNNTICKVSWDERIELAQIALAAMDSEPVAWLRNPDQGFHLPMLRMGSKDPNPNFVNEEFYPVYAVPQPAPVVPDGYVMVPKEPTAEMILSAMRDNETGEVAEIYELMLAAAPQEVK
ncbi:hypothetical protein [Klebsiella pneumoniae]|uniref:hypothetical protein n=1 Tax=Klebsiella pneumoniae TaxID=573 RepID=UPI000E203C64|nr:hypothetical protein [Klebsiella pneumoniae]MCI8031086.1 hypothetical protein [Klebsiella pneumoniae]SWY95534.1 Uncharacterised protein [Klebsiella pneumoniae]HBR4428704.1 hypothetical protein [Klebsiella pneumoniae]HBR4437153.1 hypothetical protein [Klebsiella pneumoniae]HBR5034309.1 hypothetical protein [Klebsiella pneumoniae]